MGIGLQAPTDIADVEYVKVLPYILVLVCAIAGMNVMAVLAMGTILCGVIGVASYYLGSPLSYDLFGWFSAMGNGITGMGELVIIAMMAGGMLEIIRENGGINYIIDKITARVHGKRGAELSIAALVSLVNICTANNTVAILTVGNIAKKIGDKFGVDNRKAASILDTFSCMVQGMILRSSDASGSRSGRNQSDGHFALSLLSGSHRYCRLPRNHLPLSEAI